MHLRRSADQRKIIDLIRSDLIGRHVTFLHKIHRGKIKGRGKAFHSKALCNFLQPWLPFPGRRRFLIQLVFRHAVPQAAAVHKPLLIAVHGKRIRRISLQLDSIRPGFLRRMDNFHRSVVIF